MTLQSNTWSRKASPVNRKNSRHIVLIDRNFNSHFNNNIDGSASGNTNLSI
jgi:hypothetical protein